MLQKFISLFFKVKYKQNQKITRFLCFRWKEKIKKSSKFVPFVPNIPYVGKCTYTGPDIYIPNSKETKIGKFCSIGLGVSLGCGRHPLNFLSSSPFIYADYMNYKDKDMVSHNEYINTVEPVNIGNDVWIGDKALIMNGVTIGDGAVIGAHAVVTKDVPPYAIAVGVPAKIIKYRFSEDIIARLLKSEWWNLPDNIIKKIPYDNISETLDFLEHLKK